MSKRLATKDKLPTILNPSRPPLTLKPELPKQSPYSTGKRVLVITFWAETGQRNGAVLFKCSGGTGLWISHMRRNSNPITSTLHQDQVASFKQPSTSVLPKHVVDGLPCIPEPPLYIPFGEKPSTFQEVINPNTTADVQSRKWQENTHEPRHTSTGIGSVVTFFMMRKCGPQNIS